MGADRELLRGLPGLRGVADGGSDTGHLTSPLSPASRHLLGTKYQRTLDVTAPVETTYTYNQGQIPSDCGGLAECKTKVDRPSS